MQTCKLFHGWTVGMVAFWLLASCQQSVSRLEAALRQSGANRFELEQVLTH